MRFDCQYRVPYADTDQMGVVYYANYLEYFERGRTEMLRAAGFPYAEMERQGIFLPVGEAHCVYRSSAHYDDLLTIRSWVGEIRGARIKLCCEVWRDGELLVSGYVVLVSLNADRRVVRVPEILKSSCSKFFESEV